MVALLRRMTLLSRFPIFGFFLMGIAILTLKITNFFFTAEAAEDAEEEGRGEIFALKLSNSFLIKRKMRSIAITYPIS